MASTSVKNGAVYRSGKPLRHPKIMCYANPKGDGSLESRPFGFAQGRLLRTERARMGHPRARVRPTKVKIENKVKVKIKTRAADRNVRSTRAAAFAKLPLDLPITGDARAVN